jgi:hypothetical protein
MNTTHEDIILSPLQPDHWVGGAAQPVFGDDIINPGGDWTVYKSGDEAQSRTGFDTEGCALFHTGIAYIMLAKINGFTDFPKDVSERYMGVLANTTQAGTDIHLLAESIRNNGLIPQEVLPWTEDTDTLAEFYSPKPMDASILSFGRKLVDRFVFGHAWVIPPGSSYTPAHKQDMLRNALTRGPVAVTISGYYRYKNEKLWKEDTDPDTHYVNLIRYEGSIPVIQDSYFPFEKELAKNYNFNAAKIYYLKRNTETIKNFWSSVWDSFAKRLWKK